MHAAFEANAVDLLAYLERRMEPRSAAADVLGDAMVIAWKQVKKLPGEPEQARMWLFVITRNTLLNHRRSISRHGDAVERLRGVIEADMSATSTEFDDADTRLMVSAAIATLSRADTELVRLVNWDGFSLAEVAKLEGIAPSTVRSRYANALRKLGGELNASDYPGSKLVTPHARSFGG